MFWRKWLSPTPRPPRAPAAPATSAALSPAVEPGAPPIPNSYWILPGQLLGGEYPGNPDGVGMGTRLQRLLEARIDFFLDLTSEDELPPYRALLPRAVEYRRHAIVDHSLPDDAARMRGIIAELETALAAGKRIYLHCRAGIGRTGTTAGCLLVERGLTGDDALYELNRLWRQCARSDVWDYVPETDGQIEFVRQWVPARQVLPRMPAATARTAPSSTGLAVSSVSLPLADRAEGALLGLAIADALANAPQPEHAAQAAATLPEELANLPWTDDTAMTLCLADSLLRCNGFDARDQVGRYREWQQSGLHSATGECLGITPATSRSLALAQWRRQVFAGSHDPTQIGPESLSRTAAAVLFCLGSRREAIEMAADAARPTSQAPQVLDSCRLLGAMLHDAFSGLPKQQVLQPDLAGIALASLKGRLHSVAEGQAPAGHRRPGAACSTAPSVLDAALWAFQSTSSFAAGLQQALALRGRTDAIAAVFGQLAGAYYGVQSIPHRWRETVPRADAIAGFAGALLRRRR